MECFCLIQIGDEEWLPSHLDGLLIWSKRFFHIYLKEEKTNGQVTVRVCIIFFMIFIIIIDVFFFHLVGKWLIFSKELIQ